MQLGLAVGRDVILTLDFESLNNQYDLIEGYMQHGLTAALGAVADVGFNMNTRQHLNHRLTSLHIIHDGTLSQHDCAFELSPDGLLAFRFNASASTDHPPRIQQAAEALKAALNITTTPEADHTTPPLEHAVQSAYITADAFMHKLEHALRDLKLWPSASPPQPLEVKGAFGCENMAYEEWLAWVLTPNVREIIHTRSTFPDHSALGVYATRIYGGWAEFQSLIQLLYDFDRFIINLNPTHRHE